MKPVHPLDERRRLPPCEWGRIALLALLLRVVVEGTLAAIILFGPSHGDPRGYRRHLCEVKRLLCACVWCVLRNIVSALF